MRLIAHGLRELEVQIDLILSSPYLRAIQTANILAKSFDLKKKQIVSSEHLAPSGYADHLIEEIKENHVNAQNVVLIGHEPYLSNLASVLITGSPDASIVLKKGGICRLAIENIQYGRCANMEWLLSPAQLVEVGDK